MKEAFALTGALVLMATSAWVAIKTYDDAVGNRVIDDSGRTSIVVEYGNGDWCELRGPGRFRLLDEWEGS